jgi:peptidoglycan/xylan/chitin deacetylase (PgdA/CDA1 family)
MQLNWNVRLGNWYRRNAGRLSFQRRISLNLSSPVISFSFDDFPQSALHVGGAILKDRGLTGTYYVSLGLLGTEAPAGRLCTVEDLAIAMREGHELGCHTYSHCDSWNTDSGVFERTLVQNREALTTIIPGASFRTFSYPINSPRPSVKRVSARHFAGCRGGGQVSNLRVADLNQLSAYFLEKARGDRRPIRDIIEQNSRAKGWLIFATHDVCSRPSPYGCDVEFFREVVEESIRSGSRILPVADALDVIRGGVT